MSRRAKGPRLYLDPKRKQFIIRDGARYIRTGCGDGEGAKAEKLLAQYIGKKHLPERSPSPMIDDVLSVYMDEVAAHRKTAKSISYNIGSLMNWWAGKTTADITTRTCREYCQGKKSQGARADLKYLIAAVKYWDAHEELGPLDRVPKFWRPPENPPRERWLTRSEAARLVKAAKPHQHLRRMILLGLYTGSRPGVILALRWSQVDLEGGVLHRTPRGEAQDAKKRAPAVRLGRRINGHLRRWKRLDGDAAYVCRFEGGNGRKGLPVADPHASWQSVLRVAKLTGVTRHTLRHTRATWMAQAGVPLFEAAGFLGMTVKTLTAIYAHHDPAHQERAANI